MHRSNWRFHPNPRDQLPPTNARCVRRDEEATESLASDVFEVGWHSDDEVMFQGLAKDTRRGAGVLCAAGTCALKNALLRERAGLILGSFGDEQVGK